MGSTGGVGGIGGPGSQYSLPPSYATRHQRTNSGNTATNLIGKNPKSRPTSAVLHGTSDGIELASPTANSFDHAAAVVDHHQTHYQNQELSTTQQPTSSIDQICSAGETLALKSLQQQQQQHVYHHNVLVDIANNTKISRAVVCHQGFSSAAAIDSGAIVDDEITNDGDGGVAAGYVRNDLVTIVTISGCTETESTIGGGEMDVLAHL